MSDAPSLPLSINKNKRRFKPKPSPQPKRRKRTDDQPAPTDRSSTPITNARPQSLDTVIRSTDTHTQPEPQLPSAETDSAAHRGISPAAPVDPALVKNVIQEYTQQLLTTKRRKKQGKTVNELKDLAAAERRIREQEQEQERETEEENPNAREIAERTVPAPQVMLVNGQIVLDEASLEFPAATPVQQDQEVCCETEESVMQADKKLWGRRTNIVKHWTRAEDELFYELLKEHGLAFEKISMCIPGRDAQQVKNKYHKEHRTNPLRITECLERASS